MIREKRQKKQTRKGKRKLGKKEWQEDKKGWIIKYAKRIAEKGGEKKAKERKEENKRQKMI